MARATVLVLHPAPHPGAGPLAACVADARASLAEVHRQRFAAAGADEVRIVSEPPDDTPFGARLRRLAAGLEGGLVVLGSGSLPLAAARDRSDLVRVAASGSDVAMANNRYSADVVAIGRAALLADLPDLDADNALPRWLAERAGVGVADLSRRWRLAVDLDGPLDVLLAARHRLAPAPVRVAAEALASGAGRVLEALEGVAAVMRDPRAELLVAGRIGSTTLRWLERSTASRTRALVEERGMRASSALAPASSPARARPPASVLGMLLDRSGPEALGPIAVRLADAALVDTRVLLAHRLGTDPSRWPSDEDRFASDLLRPDLIDDPWLRALTESAAVAPVPVALGGHSLVGPGIRLVAADARP